MRFFVVSLSTLFLFAGNSTFLPAQEKGEKISLAETKKGIPGQEAPEIAVEKWIQLPDGKTSLSIKDYEGKILIMLFFQSWCKGSHAHGFPVLKKLVDHYNGEDQVKFLAIQTTFEGIMTNTAEKLAPTAKQFGLEGIPFGHYTKTASYPGIMGAYNSGGTPWFVVVNTEGKVEYNGFQLDEKMAIAEIDKMLKK